MNEYFQPASVPATNSPGSSAVIRGEFGRVASGFDLLPSMLGNNNELVVVDAIGSSLVTSGYSFTDVVTLNGVQLITNKTATTPPVGDSSLALATTEFVSLTLNQIGAVTAGFSAPYMDGVAYAGDVNGFAVSREDHVHPSDTSRAPINSPVLTGNPQAPTASPGDSSASIASTAFVTAADTLINAQVALSVKKTSDSGSALLPIGSDAQRDAVPITGALRYSTTNLAWEGWSQGAWTNVGNGQMYGKAANKGIFYNSQSIGENLTVKSGSNGGTFGPITVEAGFSVTVEPGSVWTIT